MVAVGVAGAEYLRFFFSLSDLEVKGIAILTIVLLTIMNIIDVKSSARFQNTLTIGKVIMIDGNPITKQKLEHEGVEVHSYDGTEISNKGAGGPTCLTRPFLRSIQ